MTRAIQPRPYVVVDLSALTETSDAQSVGLRCDSDQLAIAVDVTVISGTAPTLDLTIEWSADGTTWAADATPDTFTQIVAVGMAFKRQPVKAPLWRLKYDIGGTGVSLTFKVVTINVGG